VVGGCGILAIPLTIGPKIISKFFTFFVGISIQGNNSLICVHEVSPSHVVLRIFFVDFFHLNRHPPTSIYHEGASNLPT
jgi:hypothetical protein